MTKAVVVTGAAGGIGAAVCRRLRHDGYLTIGMDCAPCCAADLDLRIDLRDTDGIIELGGRLAREHDVKAIVHNAAVQPIAAAGRTAVGDWLDTVRVNLLAVDALLAGTRDSLATTSGSVVVISSVHARATTGGITAYATTKAAVEGWVRSAAIDLAPAIRVNAVAPGAIDTAKLHQGFARWGTESAERRKAALAERTPLRRIGESRDVAGAVSFLLGEDASFITGTTLVVDGGATARLASE